MKLGDVLYESGDELRYVYFPTTCIISLLYVMEDGASAEIAVVGNEGILGISLFMGGNTTPSRAIVQSAGHAYRLKADLLKNEFERYGPTMHLLLRYTQGKRPGNSSCPDARYQLGVVAGVQLCGSNSPMRLAGWVGSLSRTSLRYR